MRTLLRKSERNLVLGRGTIDRDNAQAQLLVDQSHSFFYDHPLDHVPGILLIEGALQLARAWSAARPGAMPALAGFSVDFRRYCLHGDPIALMLDATDALEPTVTLTQNGASRATVTLRLADAPTPRHGDMVANASPGDIPSAPACSRALNKWNAANVMITQPVRRADGWHSRLLPPDPANALVDPLDAPEWHPLTLLEAFMQVLRYRNSHDPQAGRMRDILQGIDLTILRPARRAETLGLFCSEETSVEGRRIIRSGQITSADEVLARIAVRTARAQRNESRDDEDTGRAARADTPALAEGAN